MSGWIDRSPAGARRAAGARRRTLLAVALLAFAGRARADSLLIPWSDPRDLPPPVWARSVAPKPNDAGEPGDMRLYATPGRAGGPRGLTAVGASFTLFAVKRGPDCTGSWWLVGPLAWTCSDDADLSRDAPAIPARRAYDDSLPAKYYFTQADGAAAYSNLESAQDSAPDRDLDGGWGVAVVDRKEQGGEAWALTTHRMWIALRELAPARPSDFHGEAVANGSLDFAWVLAERAGVWASPASKGKPKSLLSRFARVPVLGQNGAMVQTGASEWMRQEDLARPVLSAPPSQVGPKEPWVDVDLSNETLVAYDGSSPVYATLVSTGRGPVGSGAETPAGIHRIWVKMRTSDMSSAERGETDAHYSLEDVPYVQFFDGAVALHGTYWHRDFGHIRSHGCVNLSPLDARWLFDFTEPRLPEGWVAVYPTPFDPGTLVRVH